MPKHDRDASRRADATGSERLSDKDPGEEKPITRRDFLDGMAIALAAGFTAGGASSTEAAPGRAAYPPALWGLRGSHPGSFETLHRLRDPQFWTKAPRARRTGETYDLVVVGAGISGLTAAHAFKRARPRARILIVDNHDDFGEHAKRNEMRGAGAFRIGYGGSQSISSPAPYSKEARGLIAELGIRVEDYDKHANFELYRSRGMGQGFFFEQSLFGVDKLVRHEGRLETDDEFLAASPLSERARDDLRRLTREAIDPWPDEDEATKRRRLARMSYRSFLLDTWKVDPSLVPLFDTRPHGLYCVGIDAVPAQDAHSLGYPGFRGLGLGTAAGPGQNLDSIREPVDAPRYFFHFPDGNASIARLLVRRLVPRAVAARGPAEMTTARIDYGALDCPDNRVRIRLSSPVLRVAHGPPGHGARDVDVTYQHAGRLRIVRARKVILACWHTTIPYICPDLSEAQREAMAYGVKVPVVYSNVLIRNWRAFERLGISRATAPGLWHTTIALDFPVSIGAYRFPRSLDQPIVVRMSKAACQPGLAARDQHRAGRQMLLETPFETIERNIRSDMQRLIGPGGFDARRDILAITVNRWPHGYSYQYNSLYDDFWLAGGETPCEVARRPFGRIAIANADAGAYAYADGAIDQGLRAAREVLAMT